MNNYLQQPVSDYAADVNLVPQVAGANASTQQEQQARAAGFRDYNQMLLWAQQRNAQSGGTVAQGAPAKHTLGQGMDAAMAWHPRNIFNYITQKWSDAMGGGQ